MLLSFSVDISTWLAVSVTQTRAMRIDVGVVHSVFAHPDEMTRGASSLSSSVRSLTPAWLA